MAPPPNPRWIELAERIRDELKRAPWGSKEAVYERHAKETGYHRHSLRRDVMALEAILKHEKVDPDFASTLRRLGSNYVLGLSRLYATEPKDAIAAAKDALEGKLTVRALDALKPRAKPSQLRELAREEAFRFAEAIGFERPHAGTAFLERDGATFFHAVGDPETWIGYLPLSGREPKVRHLHDALALAFLHRRVLLGIDFGQIPKEWSGVASKLAGTNCLPLVIYGRTHGRHPWGPILGRIPR